MILFPMLGTSSRFKKVGITIPKFQLKIDNKSLFAMSVETFKEYFNKEHFIFIVNNEFDNINFVNSEAKKIGIVKYTILNINHPTRGQAETVNLALNKLNDQSEIFIFNIDTIIKNFKFPDISNDISGYIDVFIGEGTNWSFIKPLNDTLVERTTEKVRISNLCSNGLYYFRSKIIYDFAFKLIKNDTSELYIAPMYNFLIQNGMKVSYNITKSDNIEHAGIPTDYFSLKKKYET